MTNRLPQQMIGLVLLFLGLAAAAAAWSVPSAGTRGFARSSPHVSHWRFSEGEC